MLEFIAGYIVGSSKNDDSKKSESSDIPISMIIIQIVGVIIFYVFYSYFSIDILNNYKFLNIISDNANFTFANYLNRLYISIIPSIILFGVLFLVLSFLNKKD